MSSLSWGGKKKKKYEGRKEKGYASFLYDIIAMRMHRFERKSINRKKKKKDGRLRMKPFDFSKKRSTTIIIFFFFRLSYLMKRTSTE